MRVEQIPSLSLRRRAGLIAVTVGVSLLVVKLTAYWMTGSSAILSDALESIINVIASLFALYAVLRSARRPDAFYPYGYGKIELFSAGFEGALVLVAAFGILWAAIPAFFAPQPLTQLDMGLVLMAVGGSINYLLGIFLIRSGRQVNSDALVADGHHVQSDAYTTLGVIVGLILVRLTGWLWVDPLLACIVALNLVLTGFRLIRAALMGLMDKVDEAFLHRLTQALSDRRRPDWIAPHHLRSWRSGTLRHIDMHLVIPRFYDLQQLHHIQKDIEAGLQAELGEELDVIVHYDPCLPAYCPLCALAPCEIRATAQRDSVEWTVDLLTAGPPFPQSQQPAKTSNDTLIQV